MGRRRRVEIFFVLYLTAIVGFIVISREREKHETALHTTMENIFRSFIPPLPLAFVQDTVYWYVDADSSRRVAPSQQMFETAVIAGDIGFDDRVSVSVASATRNGLLVSPGIARLGSRRGYGGLTERRIAFPVHCVFANTGTYRVNVKARAERMHLEGDSVLRYRDHRISASWLDASTRRRLESNTATLTVVVEDTSLTTGRAMEALRMTVSRPTIETAFGYQETNTVTLNHAWFEPSVRLVRGPGRLSRVASTSRDVVYRWIGTVSGARDSVLLEARIAREAGGKDLATASFMIQACDPILTTSLPQRVFAGEDLRAVIRVAGLNEDTAYAWTLFEVADVGSPVKKDSGRGPVIQYRIPSSFAGKRLVVAATYGRRQYRFIDQTTYTGSASRFEFPVSDPPVRIAFTPDARAHVASKFQFTAAMYENPSYRNARPVGTIKDISVVVKNQRGVVVPTIVAMVGKGRFEFSLADKKFIRLGGEWIDIAIRVGGGAVDRRVFMDRSR